MHVCVCHLVSVNEGALSHKDKGVFTRLREPKLAAHKLRELWGGRDI